LTVLSLIEAGSAPNVNCRRIGRPLVFMDTTTLYCEGCGGKTLGHKGKSKD